MKEYPPGQGSMRDEYSPSHCQVSVRNKKSRFFLERIKLFNKNVLFVIDWALKSAMLCEVEVESLTEMAQIREHKN